MKPKKKKAGKIPSLCGFVTAKTQDEFLFRLASRAFDESVDRAKMCPNHLPIRLIQESILHLARGKPLVFAHDPRTYAQMVVKNTG